VVVGLGKMETLPLVGLGLLLTDAGVQPPMIFSDVSVSTTGLSSKNTPAWLKMVVPSGKPAKVFILNTTWPLHCGHTFVSKRFIPGKSNFTILYPPSLYWAIFMVFDAIISSKLLGSSVLGSVSIT